MRKVKYSIAAVFDTETTNLGTDPKTARAIPILYIDNDIRDVDLTDYTPDRDDHILLLRTEDEYIERIEEYIKWGRIVQRVPIITAYNLMFDLQSLLQSLAERYDVQVNAQSSTNVYTYDLREKGSGDNSTVLLRFWDTFHLDMRGLAKMGEVAGLEKASGDWDYSKIRTSITHLSDEEIFYAKRDVQVIPKFLSFLLATNDWLRQDMLGCIVLTKTSLVRQMAKHDIGPKRIEKKDHKKITVEKMFLELCKQEAPRTYNQYALRKACFRGGYTFTAAAYASTIQRNVVSVDVTSMHHQFINGRFIPVKFAWLSNSALRSMCESILATSRDEVMEHYERPFKSAIHARIRFDGIRLKEGSAFERYGIALCPMSKFKHLEPEREDEASYAAEEAVITNGWHDMFTNATFAFGKLYEADSVTLHINEVELWCMSRVYEWDSFKVIYGEGTSTFTRPPDYVTLQSNVLYKLKDDNKFIANHYREGEPYPYNIPDTVPEGYRNSLRDGSILWEDFNAYYTNDTKGKFNGIYGTMAQDVYKPSYKSEGGVISVDQSTVVTTGNWDERRKESTKVLYTYGMRIVGGSRMHMVLAIERMHETFGDAARVLGGDTDSMKISFDETVTDSDIDESLRVFGEISETARNVTMQRVRRLYPKQASSLRGVGGFEIENAGNHYRCHVELWNKCRCSVAADSTVHITCAGLSRPSDRYHIERFMHDFIQSGYKDEDVLRLCVGYNVFVCHQICHALEGHRPKPTDKVSETIEDYEGSKADITAHEVVCLYPVGRWLGETMKRDNRATVEYLSKVYDRGVDVAVRRLYANEVTGEIEVTRQVEGETETTVMMGVSEWLKSHSQGTTTGTERLATMPT